MTQNNTTWAILNSQCFWWPVEGHLFVVFNYRSVNNQIWFQLSDAKEIVHCWERAPVTLDGKRTQTGAVSV